MEGGLNYAEYSVPKKPEGKNLIRRLLMICLYLAVLSAIIILVAATNGGGAVYGGVLFVLFIALVWFTWKLVQEERKYEVVNAKLKICEVNARGKEKVVEERLVSEYALIAPMTEEYREKWANADVILEERGNTASKDSYFARREKDGETVVVRFEATNKMLKVMKFYNSRATVIQTCSR